MITLSGGWDLGYAIHHYNRPEGGCTLLGEAIYRDQYRKQWYLVDALSRWAQSALQETPSLRQPDLLIPVPSTGFSVDYDPTHLLVNWLSQLTGIPRAVGILNRQGLISEYGDPEQEMVRGTLQVTATDAVKGRKVQCWTAPSAPARRSTWPRRPFDRRVRAISTCWSSPGSSDSPRIPMADVAACSRNGVSCGFSCPPLPSSTSAPSTRA
ncbi:MAG: hypothetical protein FJY99_07240 [Candidatus Sericytochromatia bacterium]|nr:hypothetical protein [Candidatus Tanganyikabacteria bacterium]